MHVLNVEETLSDLIN